MSNSTRLTAIFNIEVNEALVFWQEKHDNLQAVIQCSMDDYGMTWYEAYQEEYRVFLQTSTVADLAKLIVAEDSIYAWNHEELAHYLDKSIEQYAKETNCDISILPFGEEYIEDKVEGRFSTLKAIDNRGKENLNKNLNSQPKINEGQLIMHSEIFTAAFNSPYSEIAPLISFGSYADCMINFEGNGQSLAELLADGFFNIINKEDFIASQKRNILNISDERIEEKWLSKEKANKRAIDARSNFLDLFRDKLGYIAPVAIRYSTAHGAVKITKFPRNVQKIMEACFAIIKVKPNEEREFSGRDYIEGMTEISLPSCVGEFWFSIIAKATFNLTVEERAQFIGFMFNNCCSVDGTIVKRDRIEIDLAAATVKTSSRILKANKASAFGAIDDSYIVLDGNHSIFMFVLSAFAGTSRQLETRINLAIKLFMPEHNYGHKPDSDDIAHFVRTNLVYFNDVNLLMDDHFGFELVGGKQSAEFLAWVLHRGVIAATDKTNIKFVTLNDGAEATGLGWNRELDRIITSNDVNKVAKLINRGAANNYDCADLDDRVASNFGFYLNSSGKVAKTKGKMMKVAFTNSKLGFGSGVGVINPNTNITYYVGKKETESFTLSIFGDKFMNHTSNKNALMQLIDSKIEDLKGQVFGPKDPILEVTIDEVKHTLVRNSSDAADIRVVSGSIIGVVNDENAVEITINVEIVETTQWVKTRRFATKFTTIPYNVDFVGMNNAWDIILNNECTKGHGAMLEMFANDCGEYSLHSAEGKLVGIDGSEVNLYDENNAVQQWKDAKRLEDVKIRMSIAKSTFDALVKAGNAEQGHSFLETIEVIEEGEDSNGNRYVLVEETIDVIFGELVFDVEISTALESVSRSNFTLESAAAVSIQDRDLGEALFGESIKKSVDMQRLVFANRGSMDEQPAVVDLTSEDMVSISQVIFPKGVLGMKHRNVLGALRKAFPNGAEIVYQVGNGQAKSTTIDFTIPLVYGSFAAASGAAARETATIVNFILDAFVNGKTSFSGIERRDVETAYRKVIKTSVESNKVLKKTTRSGELVYGKVRTSFHPILDSKDGIPTIVLNRNCPIVRLLGVKDWDSFVNYYVGFCRTPMPFLGAGRLILTDDQSICGNAHVLVDPIVWHALNEGDSDGDGIAVINLETVKDYKVTTEKVKTINASKMGIGGYEYLYGENIPFIDFISESDKQGKKSLRGNACLLNSQLKDPDTGDKVYITSAYLGDFAARVASHYVAAVGTAYGICSKLIFDAADRAYGSDEKRFDALVDANLIAWRAIYEGLGLSGYSADASKFFHLLMCATNDTKFESVWSPNSNWKEVDVRFDYPKEEWVGGEILLRDAIKEIVGVELSTEVFTQILRSRIVTRVAPKVEGFGELKKWWQKSYPAAVKFGALRRISQGSQRAAFEMGFIEEAEWGSSGQFVPKPLAVKFHEKNASKMFENPYLGALASSICEYHTVIYHTKQANIDASLYGNA